VHSDIRIAVKPLQLDIAIPCGLIMNELITNALKHAFPDGREGIISIRMEPYGEATRICVKDNGIGIQSPADGENPLSLGLILVENLVEQLQGKLTQNFENGTEITIVF